MTISVSSDRRRAREAAPDNLVRQIAESMQVTPCERDWPPGDIGFVTALRHPTGWYISARSRHDLHVDEREMFQQFVTRRVRSLLTAGPTPGMWLPGENADQWQTFSTSPRLGGPHTPADE